MHVRRRKRIKVMRDRRRMSPPLPHFFIIAREKVYAQSMLDFFQHKFSTKNRTLLPAAGHITKFVPYMFCSRLFVSHMASLACGMVMKSTVPTMPPVSSQLSSAMAFSCVVSKEKPAGKFPGVSRFTCGQCFKTKNIRIRKTEYSAQKTRF